MRCGVASNREEIDEAHSKLRENLRGFSRKRHRESVKRTKKKGSELATDDEKED